MSLWAGIISRLLSPLTCRPEPEQVILNHLPSQSKAMNLPLVMHVVRISVYMSLLNEKVRGEKVGISPEILHSNFERFRKHEVEFGHSFLHESLPCFGRRTWSVPVGTKDEKCGVFVVTCSGAAA